MPEDRPFRLLIEGWRNLPHSYAIVNQFQCLALLKRPDVQLWHRDMPPYNPNWKPGPSLFDAPSEAQIKTLRPPAEHDTFDAVLRIDFPHRVLAAANLRTCIYMTAEYKRIAPTSIAQAPSLAQAADADVCYITPSEWSKQGLLASGAAESQIAVVPHGVDPLMFQPATPEARAELRKRLQINGFLFAHFGAMSGNKNVPMLLKAFAAVAAKHPDTRLFLKGMDHLYPSKHFAAAAGGQLSPEEMRLIEPRIIYRGETFNFATMAQLYQASDAYVAPYMAEGFNLPVLEAAACGLPVICTAGGSTDDFTTPDFALRIEATEVDCLLAPEITGRRLAPSLDSLIAHMLAVVENPAIGEKARTAGPAFVADGFLWSQVTERLLKATRGN